MALGIINTYGTVGYQKHYFTYKIHIKTFKIEYSIKGTIKILKKSVIY